MEEVKTSDMYEAAYYLSKGCEITAIEGRNLNGHLVCDLTFSGRNINRLQAQYFQGEVEVNIFAFRRSYSHLMSYLAQAKKKLKRELATGGEA